ncbi:MAG: glycine cleavage system aminomethyltransferase GcvT [Deltaproteobacteria bacterium]|nr:glycine cleavage system aminomethyltransferase GcvT [Deltaproteobacteria bacterium]
MKTPLYEIHKSLKARIVDFAGWEMPVQYTSIMEEHRHVREKAGLFDVSHMGEITIKGKKALEAIQFLTTNDVRTLKDGDAQYTLLLNHEGNTLDDLIVYRRGPEDFFLCVNASNTIKDFEWMKKIAASRFEGVTIEDKSSSYGLLAIQGPLALSIMEKISPVEPSAMKPFSFIELSLRGGSPKGGSPGGIPVLLSRTGYTGEDGFEIFTPWEKTVDLWNLLMESGRKEDLRPIGLAARDTLRIEMKYCLYGHEINESTNPFEAGLGWVVKLDKGDFIGKEELVSKQKGIERKLVCFLMKETGIPRQGYSLHSEASPIGVVTSGTFSPSLEKPIGIGYVTLSRAKTGTQIAVDIRGQKKRAEIVTAPFIRKKS